MHNTAKDHQGQLSSKSNSNRASAIFWLIYSVLTAPYVLFIANLAKGSSTSPFVISFVAFIGIASMGAIVGLSASSAMRYFWKGAPASSILTPLCSSILLICYYATFGVRLATQG